MTSKLKFGVQKSLKVTSSINSPKSIPFSFVKVCSFTLDLSNTTLTENKIFVVFLLIIDYAAPQSTSKLISLPFITVG